MVNPLDQISELLLISAIVVYAIAFIAFALFIVAIVGWVYEYYRGYFAH